MSYRPGHRCEDAPRIIHFGKGALVVGTGTLDGAPAVFIKRASKPGPVGDTVPPWEDYPLDSLVAGEIVLTFPTEAQMQSVANSLVTLMEATDE